MQPTRWRTTAGTFYRGQAVTHDGRAFRVSGAFDTHTEGWRIHLAGERWQDRCTVPAADVTPADPQPTDSATESRAKSRESGPGEPFGLI